MWKGLKVLVTGGAGFIGSHLVEALVARGATVRVFARYTSRGDFGLLSFASPQVLDSIEMTFGALEDPDAVDLAVKGQDVVFHAAALIGIPYSYVHPLHYVQTNVLGTTHVLTACRRHDVRRLVTFSTSEVYGTAQYTPIDEGHPLVGQSPYSATKIAADQLALSFWRAFELPVAVARPFNTYGPRQSARAVIPTIVSQALRSSEVRLGSLEPTRDLVFVEDTVAGVIRVAEANEAVGEVINLGTGREISIGALAHKIFERLGREPRIVTEPNRLRPKDSEVERLLASGEKAKRLLDFEPKIDLNAGLDRTIAWIREHQDFFGSKQGYSI